MVEEVRRQFREVEGILEGTTKPDYKRCVQISTNASLHEMIAPGALVMLAPIITVCSVPSPRVCSVRCVRCVRRVVFTVVCPHRAHHVGYDYTAARWSIGFHFSTLPPATPI
jgi:Na+/H+-translocating membrane pyrophosphatase